MVNFGIYQSVSICPVEPAAQSFFAEDVIVLWCRPLFYLFLKIVHKHIFFISLQPFKEFSFLIFAQTSLFHICLDHYLLDLHIPILLPLQSHRYLLEIYARISFPSASILSDFFGSLFFIHRPISRWYFIHTNSGRLCRFLPHLKLMFDEIVVIRRCRPPFIMDCLQVFFTQIWKIMFYQFFQSFLWIALELLWNFQFTLDPFILHVLFKYLDKGIVDFWCLSHVCQIEAVFGA